ncbi:MAG TPA: Rieske 2Fe-2S domain-containing protein [Nocardioidaceae bacterium]|nr:Rieske 2Fe-2S domain-containing protein [Nocardioidaceae bacterium]
MWWSTLTGRLEEAERLDPAAEKVGRLVTRVLPPGPVKDALHGRWLGHQLHPLLVAVPIGMWSGATLLDLTAGRDGHRAAQRLVGAGVLLVAPTAASGWADWSELGAFQRPKRVGLVHAAANNLTTIVYAASWLARRRGDHSRGRRLALLGATGLGIGGYLGGHLAYSQGVGVDRNADEPKKPREWTDAAAAADVPAEGLLRIEVAGQQVVLARVSGQLHAIGATCSHYGAPLDQGSVEGGCLVCPWHGSRFRLSDGSVARGPATSAQLSYDVRMHGDRVQLRVRA